MLLMYDLRRALGIIYTDTHSNLSAGGNVSGVDGAASALIFVVNSFRTES